MDKFDMKSNFVIFNRGRGEAVSVLLWERWIAREDNFELREGKQNIFCTYELIYDIQVFFLIFNFEILNSSDNF